MGGEWTSEGLGDVVTFKNRLRIPLSAEQRERRPGPYLYWGANGPFASVDDYLFDGPHVLVAEDGNTVVRPDGRGTVHWADGQYWVNNHAHVLGVQRGHSLRWLYYALVDAQVGDFVSGSAQPKLSMGALRRLVLNVPPPDEQCAIVSVLGALDDKIESNRRLAAKMREALLLDHRHRLSRASGEALFGDLVELLSRGRAPRYVESGTIVLNQRCVRGGEVDYSHARATDAGKLRRDERLIREGDVLVNSTGVGTLGRTALVEWRPEHEVCADSHVTIVRADPDQVRPSWLASDLLQREGDIAALAEGSTGQTELSKSKLANLVVRLADDPSQAEHDLLAGAIGSQRAALARETLTLTAIRDALLPKLVSGQIRVPPTRDEQEAVETVVAELDARPRQASTA